MAEEIDQSKSLAYKTLKQTHPTYDAAFYAEITDLYVGGYRIQKNAHRYLPRLINEDGMWHADRLRTAGYQPFVSQIIDQFTAELFGQPLNVQPAADAANPDTPGMLPDTAYYARLANNADGAGHPFVDVMRSVMTTALMKGPLLVAIDAPALAPGQEPTTKAQENQLGVSNFYIYDLPPEALLDWEMLDHGRFSWCVVHKIETPRKSPKDSRSLIVETFTIWSMDGSKARWDRYVCEYNKENPPDDETAVKWVDGDTTSFDRIPILRRSLPEGFVIGQRIGPMQREHYQRRSTLISAQNRSLVAMPIAALGGELGAGGEIPAEVAQNPDRGNDPVGVFNRKGFNVIGKDDKVYFAEPSGQCYEIVDRQLEHLREAMLQVNHQMALAVRPTGKSIGRSGASKEKDAENTEKVLRALGHEVREFSLEIFETIAKARGEEVVWAAHGLDTFESDDRKDMLEEAMLISTILASIPSLTFRIEFVYQTAKKLMPGLGPETMSQIRREIVEAAKSIDEHADLMQEALTAQVDPDLSGGGSGAAATPPGMPSPKGKKPTIPGAPKPGGAGGQGRDPHGHFS